VAGVGVRVNIGRDAGPDGVIIVPPSSLFAMA
jgi:hypothetical protein